MAERLSERQHERPAGRGAQDELAWEYERILCAHLVQPSEKWRFAAADLGKRMVASTMGPETLVAIHGGCLRRCRAGVAARASEILLEAMLAFALEYHQLAEARLKEKDYLAAHARVLEGLNRDLVALQHEMTERHNDLQESHAELGRLAAQKSDLLATVTHEIRTPLTAILGFGEFLEEGTYGDLNLEQTEILHKMTQGGRDLLDLVNRILDISRIEAGRLVLDLQPSDVNAAIEHAVEQVKPQAQRKPLQLTIHKDPAGLPLVWADPLRVVEIVANLLSNAVKFTPAGGAVELGARLAGDCVETWVSDSGPGIELDQQRKLFEKYAQTPEGARRYGSSGLGLALCRELVNLQGGKIWIESEPEHGATFRFTLPIWKDGSQA